MEDFAMARSFVMMEDRLPELMGRPVKNLMTTPVKTITKETPLMKALSMMLLNNFSHIPVVNENKELRGIISQGDIFRAIASSEIPYDSDEEYHDWIARHFDVIYGNTDRYGKESADLDRLFKKHNVKKTVNIGTGTGSHDVLLAEKGYETTGIESSRRMYQASMQKKLSLSADVQRRIRFLQVDDYIKELDTQPDVFDAALFMGNALAHIPHHYAQVLKANVDKLRKGGLVVLELVNVEKVLMFNNRLNNFLVAPSRLTPKREFAFLEYYDPVRDGQEHMMLTMAVFAFNGRRWSFRGINSTPLAYLPIEKTKKLLSGLGLKNISVTGSRYGEPIFDRAPNMKEDDWITFVAEK
jgi:SAM-dependent methyltransferase